MRGAWSEASEGSVGEGAESRAGRHSRRAQLREAADEGPSPLCDLSCTVVDSDEDVREVTITPR